MLHFTTSLFTEGLERSELRLFSDSEFALRFGTFAASSPRAKPKVKIKMYFKASRLVDFTVCSSVVEFSFLNKLLTFFLFMLKQDKV